MWSVPRSYLKDNYVGSSVQEAGLNTSTVTLRLVGSDEKGSLESETVKYGHKTHMGLGPENDCAGKDQEPL
jgi:hypothetical protein